MWITVSIAILLAVMAVAMIKQMRGRRVGGIGGGARGAAGLVQGTMTLTGVSERPQADSVGEAFCTVSGTIVGPGTRPAEVYGTMVLGQGQPWPQIGSELPVVYKPGKAETSWHFGELPPPPQVPGQMPPSTS
ncbi:hypothetical protein EF294_16985 [Gordonia oryzae]|uniref:Uncharacterized protein n=1 Tax=Gordonia oryzae TaxID=2487349 RepID=A0A3N4G9T2_9ACTN|nr:hypothetical protein [Gordonia oryzae]RPA58107.1 hypothetical protein EF294_16985 [Gordonia oryzae]